jgi:predicted GNAT family N-acyltransferase
MTFREIVFASADYDQEWRLRNEVLRIPLGLDLGDEVLAAERDHWHFGLFDEEGGLCASVVAVPVSPESVKIRQMAVAPRSQGAGLGRKLVAGVEEILRQRGVKHCFLYARVPVVPFYEKLGYERVGDEFIEVGITHLEMEKTLGGA